MCLKMTCKGPSGKECLNLSVYKERQKRWDGDFPACFSCLESSRHVNAGIPYVCQKTSWWSYRLHRVNSLNLIERVEILNL